MKLARDGFRVVAIDRDGERLEPAVAALGKAGLDVKAAVPDICERAEVAAVIASEPRVDAMVCAAGIYNDAAFLDLHEDAFRQMLDVNVVGTFIPAQEAARRMQAGGRIVTVSSRGALGGTRFAHYVASKAAVIGLTRAMAMELRARQIAVNQMSLRFELTLVSARRTLSEAWREQRGARILCPLTRRKCPGSAYVHSTALGLPARVVDSSTNP